MGSNTLRIAEEKMNSNSNSHSDINLELERIRIGVVGGGSWGTALSNLLALKGFKVDLWVYEEEVRKEMVSLGENRTFLPGFSLSPNLNPTNDLELAVADKDLVLNVVPSHLVRRVTTRMAAWIRRGMKVVSASKGIENKTHLTMSGVLGETLPELEKDDFAVLSGPSFAKEVANKFPTVVTVASKNIHTAELVQKVFFTPYLRVYTSQDVIGVELGGSVKNIIAIAAGIIDGLGLGLNSRAALITRGLTEIRRLGLKLGANPRTFTGLAGAGDLILTCTGDLSRNHTIGKKIGQGHRLTELLANMRMVAEGVKTAKSVYNMSRKLDVEMPICHAIYRILYEDLDPKKAAYQLMTRDLKQELDEV
jgi:glycerol-3-phosphate dehydrogenase (NAD(P)+)